MYNDNLYKTKKNKSLRTNLNPKILVKSIEIIDYKKIIIDSISASTIIIFVLLVFELIFYFLVTKQDIIKYLKHIDKRIPKQQFVLEELFYKLLNKHSTEGANILIQENETRTETSVYLLKKYRDKLVNIYNTSIEQLILEDTTNFEKYKFKKYIELGLYIGLYTIFIIVFHYNFRSNISWRKISIILFFSYTLIIICEVFFYYKVYSKVRLVDDHKLVNNIINEIKK